MKSLDSPTLGTVLRYKWLDVTKVARFIFYSWHTPHVLTHCVSTAATTAISAMFELKQADCNCWFDASAFGDFTHANFYSQHLHFLGQGKVQPRFQNLILKCLIWKLNHFEGSSIEFILMLQWFGIEKCADLSSWCRAPCGSRIKRAEPCCSGDCCLTWVGFSRQGRIVKQSEVNAKIKHRHSEHGSTGPTFLSIWSISTKCWNGEGAEQVSEAN